MKILLCKWKENREVEMMQSISSYINPNTRGLTSNYKNTAIKDKEAYNGVMSLALTKSGRGSGTSVGANAIIFAFAPIENENRTLDQEEQKKFRKQALIILVLADMAIIISHKIHIEVCQWLLNGMIVAALLNLCGKIQTKCRAYKN